MSRTPKHRAAKTKNREYWGRKSVVSGLRTPGSDTKRRTSRAERRTTKIRITIKPEDT